MNKAEVHELSGCFVIHVDSHSIEVSGQGHASDKAMAERIALALDNHERMLAALRAVEAALGKDPHWNVSDLRLKIVRTAIAAADSQSDYCELCGKAMTKNTNDSICGLCRNTR